MSPLSCPHRVLPLVGELDVVAFSKTMFQKDGIINRQKSAWSVQNSHSVCEIVCLIQNYAESAKPSENIDEQLTMCGEEDSRQASIRDDELPDRPSTEWVQTRANLIQ